MWSKIIILFDGDCLVCNVFKRYIDRMYIWWQITYISLRDVDKVKKLNVPQDIDINDGFLLFYEQTWHQWADALEVLDRLSQCQKNNFQKFFHSIVKIKSIREMAYICGYSLRKVLLVLQCTQPLDTNLPSMKGSCCPGKCLVHIVFGGSMALLGLGKLLGGPEAWTMVGNMGLSLFNTEAFTFAMILGFIVAIVELLGGLSFALKCNWTSKYSAIALTIVMLVALLVLLKNSVGNVGELTSITSVNALIMAVQGPLLYGTVFAGYAITSFGCCSVPAAKKAPAKKAPARKK